MAHPKTACARIDLRRSEVSSRFRNRGATIVDCLWKYEPVLDFKSTLFLITGLFDGAANRGLAFFQGLIDVRFTRQHSRDILAHYSAEGLKFRDAHKLDAGVWHRLDAGFGRV